LKEDRLDKYGSLHPETFIMMTAELPRMWDLINTLPQDDERHQAAIAHILKMEQNLNAMDQELTAMIASAAESHQVPTKVCRAEPYISLITPSEAQKLTGLNPKEKGLLCLKVRLGWSMILDDTMAGSSWQKVDLEMLQQITNDYRKSTSQSSIEFHEQKTTLESEDLNEDKPVDTVT
jgi:hypothetical protein